MHEACLWKRLNVWGTHNSTHNVVKCEGNLLSLHPSLGMFSFYVRTTFYEKLIFKKFSK